MRILLDVVLEKDLSKSLRAFQTNKGCHTDINQIKAKFGKVNIEQQYLKINHNILVEFLREKLQDEFLISFIYKYVRIDWYGELINE